MRLDSSASKNLLVSGPRRRAKGAKNHTSKHTPWRLSTSMKSKKMILGRTREIHIPRQISSRTWDFRKESFRFDGLLTYSSAIRSARQHLTNTQCITQARRPLGRQTTTD